MKKIAAVLALLLTVTACSNAPEQPKQDDNKPAAMTTLDVETFASELKGSEKVKAFIADEEDLSATALEEYVSDEALKNEIADSLSNLQLEKADNQNKVYGFPRFFVDLNTVLDANYVRLAVFEDVLVVQTNNEFVNYTLNEENQQIVNTVIDQLFAAYAEEE